MQNAEPSGANRAERDSLCAPQPAGAHAAACGKQTAEGSPKGEAGGPSQRKMADVGFFRMYGIDHVQLAMPRGQEDAARAFYSGVLGLDEVEKPAHLARRGGVWFGRGALQVHLGVEESFQPARKAHPAFLVEQLRCAVARCQSAGIAVMTDEPLDGCERVYITDPFGNRIELIERQRCEENSLVPTAPASRPLP